MRHWAGLAASLWLFVVAVTLSGCPPPNIPDPTPQNGLLRVENQSSQRITRFYASRTANDSWGNSVLTGAIAPESSRSFNVPAGIPYDFAAVFENGGTAASFNNVFGAGQTKFWTLRDEDIQGGDPVGQLTLYVKNGTACPITHLRVTRTGSDTDAVDGLATPIQPGQTRRFDGLVSGMYRFSAVGGCSPDPWSIGPEPFGLDPDSGAAIAESKLLELTITAFGWGYSFMECYGDGQFRCVD